MGTAGVCPAGGLRACSCSVGSASGPLSLVSHSCAGWGCHSLRVAFPCSQSGARKLSNSLYKILICPESSQNCLQTLQSSISHHHQIAFSSWNPAEFLAQAAASCRQVLLPAQTSRIPWALSILCVESGSDGHDCNNPHVIPTPFYSALFPPKPKCFLTAKVQPVSSPWGEKHCFFCSQKRSCKGREWA